MPLPDPLYLTQEEFYWDDSQYLSLLVLADAAPLGTKRVLRWHVDAYDRPMIHDLIMGYAVRAGTPRTELTAVSGFAPGSAYHTIDFDGTALGASATGLTPGVDYTFSVVLGLVETFYTVNGTNGATFTDLVSAINAALPGTMNAYLFEDNIEIESVATGAPQLIEVFDETLFRSTAGFIGLKETRAGVSIVGDVFDLNLNFRKNYQPYTELLIGALRSIANKAPMKASRTPSDIYFNHGTKTWLYVQTDLPPP